MTTFEEFRASVADGGPPAQATPALQALWWAQKGDWDRAHGCVQAHEGHPDCDLVHAWLHRQEGDLGNATYWYRSAGRPPATIPLAQEWREIATELLARQADGDA